MKTQLILSIFLLGIKWCGDAAPVNLIDAMKQNKIAVTITGNKSSDNPKGSSHTGKCLLLNLTNHSAGKIEVKIESAYQFENQSKQNQDLICTENMIVSLGANQTKNVAVNALCTEKSNASPKETDTFLLVKRQDQVYIKLTDIFQKYKCYHNTAQQAVWCFTDNNPIDNIFDTDTDTLVENELVAYVSTVKGVAAPSRKRYVSTPRILRYPIEVDSALSIHIERITTIGIYLTDSSHHILKVLIDEDTERRVGTAKYSYFYRGQLPKGTYYVAMQKNGEWINLQKFLLGEGN